MGVHWKIQLLGEYSRKTNIKGALPKKGAWTVYWFRGGLGKKEEGGLIPQYTLWWTNAFFRIDQKHEKLR